MTTNSMKNSKLSLSNRDKKSSIANAYAILNMQKKLEKYGFLVDDFKKKNSFSLYFTVFDIIRNAMLAIIIVFSTKQPFLQIILISSINIAMIIYILIFNPFENKKTFILTIFNEFTLCSVCLICVFIANLDRVQNEDNKLKFNAGWFLFYIDLTFKIIISINFFIELLM